MRKFYPLIVAMLLITSNAIAQIRAYEAPAIVLTEEIIAQRVGEARKQGSSEWELDVYNKALHRKMWKQQSNLNANERTIVPNIVQAACTNVDFEQGNYNGWTLTSGDINGATLPCNTCASSPGGIAAATTSGSSGATWTNGVDNCSGQPVVAPGGGNYSLCLNDASTGGKMQMIKQTFAVTATNNVFTYDYLAVLQDAGHTTAEQPYFMSQVLDGSNNVIPCTYVYQTGGPSATGWTNVPSCGGIYKGWVTVTLDLTSYIGQNVTIEFLVSDCTQGGHFGYCYIDADCNQIQANNTVTICPGSTQLCGPAGFNTYSWSGPVTGNTMCLNTSTPGSYTLVTTGQCPAPTRYYTVTVSPTPTVNFTSTVTPCNNTVPFTDLSTISGGASITSYSWDFGDGGNSTTQNPSHTYGGPGTYNVVLTATSNVGCSDSYTATVTIGTGPTAAFTANTVCLGLATNFTNTSSGATGGYTWNFGDGSGTSTATSPTHTYGGAGTYTVTLTAAGTGTCQATTTQVITVNGPPTVTATSATACAGASATITAGGASTYTWNPTGTVAPSLSASPAATTGYTVTGTSVAGCTNTATGTITIAPNPTVSTVPTAICAGSTGTISASGANSYQWSGTSIVGASNTATITANPGATSTYTVIGTSNTCTASATAVITVNPMPVPSFVSSVECLGTATSFTNNSTPAGSTYVWDFGDNNTSTNPSPTETYPADGQYAVTLTVTAPGNCTATVTNTVTVKPIPALSPVSNVAVCDQQTINVQSYTSTPAGATVGWTNDNPSIGLGASGTGNINPFIGSAAGSGVPISGIVTATPTLTGCVGPPITFTLTVNPMPVPAFVSSVECFGTATSFTNNSTPAGSSYNWNMGDGTTTGVPTPTDTYTAAGSYVVTLTVTAPGSCTATTTGTVVVKPIPALNPVSNVTVCDQQQIVVQPFVSVPAGATTGWTNDNATIGLAASGTGNITPFPGSTGGSPTPISGIVTATPTLTGCVGPPINFTLTVSPNPTVTLTAPPLTCPGQTVPAPGYTMNPNDPATQFTWTNSNILTGMSASGAGTPTSFTAASNATLANITGTVVVTPTLGVCVGQPATYTVTIYPTPVINPIANIVKCPNQAVPAIPLSVLPATGSPSFAWSNSNTSIGLANTGTVTPIPGFTSVNTGTTQQVANISVGASLNGCPAVPVPFSITVNPNPIAAFSANNKICYGFPMSFTDQSTVGSGFIAGWSWVLDAATNPAFATTQNPVYTVPASGQHNVTLTATTDQGCVNVVMHPIYINPIPTALFNGGKAGCPILTFNNFKDSSLVSDNTGIKNWSWSFGNGATYNASAPSSPNPPGTLSYGNPSPTQNATYTVSLVVTSDSGCVSPTTSKACVTVYPHPLPGFSFGPIDPAPDINNPIVYFFDQSQGANGPGGLTWYLGDVFLNNLQNNYTTVQNPVHAYEHYDPYTYYVTQWVSNIYGCKDSLTKPVEVLPNWTFYIPNAFSPNGDGINEGFKGTGVGIDTTTYNIWIFDRWGNQVFYSDDMEKNWDGHIQGKSGDVVQEDVYVWKVKFHDFLGKKHEYKGTVSVIK